jgi:hypothetical protein
MLDDYLDYIIKNYREKFPDKFIEGTAKARALNPNYDNETNERFKKALKNIEVISI